MEFIIVLMVFVTFYLGKLSERLKYKELTDWIKDHRSIVPSELYNMVKRMK